jgi:hypothetical protein
MEGFGDFFFKIVKINFNMAACIKKNKKEKNNPLYYMQEIHAMPDNCMRQQLLSAFIITCNHFRVHTILGDYSDLPQWSRFTTSLVKSNS